MTQIIKHDHSSKFRIMTVVGARPQFVKAAAVSPSLAATGVIEELIVHTGQHFDHLMSDIFFEEMGIPKPYINLGVGGGSHGQNTGRMIESLERVFLDNKPDAVLVYGDTDSTLATAIAASKLGLPLIHIEAGLRSFRRAMPEEINRVLTDHVSDILYAPSARAVQLLKNEGIHGDKVVNVGDVMFDVVKRFITISKEKSGIINRLELNGENYQLLTMHRKENVDDPFVLKSLLDAIDSIGRNTVFLVHPRTANVIKSNNIKISDRIKLLDPVGYMDMLQLIEGCSIVLTDSGGLQKEAYFLGKPCVTLRTETEWSELVEAGVNILAGTSTASVVKALNNFECKSDVPKGIYGNGNSADAIAADLLKRLQTGV